MGGGLRILRTDFLAQHLYCECKSHYGVELSAREFKSVSHYLSQALVSRDDSDVHRPRVSSLK